MISFILRNGSEFTGVSLLSATEESFTLGEESFTYQKNYAEKSNEAGSEEIGQRRIEASTFVITGDWVAASDLAYKELINPLLSAFDEIQEIRDIDLTRRLKVSPVDVVINHEPGCFRRSGKYTLQFIRLSPYWEDEAENTQTFTVPSLLVTYQIVTFGSTDVRSKMIFISEADISSLDITVMLPGVNGVKDRVVGVLSLVNLVDILCPIGRGIVIDNALGLCYTSPVTGITVTDEDRIDLKSFIRPGTSFFKNVSGVNGFSITTDADLQVTITWNNKSLT